MKKSLRFLIAEDEPELNEALTAMVIDWFDAKTDNVEGPKGAIELLRENQYDLVLTDLSMIGGTGYEILEFIENSKIRTPAIVLTGQKGFPKVMEKLESYKSCTLIIGKPYEQRFLKDTLSQILRGHEVA